MEIFGLSCPKTSQSDIRWHRAATVYGREGNVHFTYLFDLFRGQGMGQVTQVHDAPVSPRSKTKAAPLIASVLAAF